MANKKHDENTRVLDLRDQLGEALLELATEDVRVDTLHDDRLQVWADMAESLIRRGWVTQFPGEE